MQSNMVFATASQMATGPQGQLLLATGQPMGQPMNGQLGQFIQTAGFPGPSYVTQGASPYIPVNYLTNQVMMNTQFQAANPVQNLAIQIPNGNNQQLIPANTPTQMGQSQQNKNNIKGNQQQGNQPGMPKTPITVNKSIHPSGQVSQGQQTSQQQPTLIQQSGPTYYVTGGQAFVTGGPTPPSQNQAKKGNNTKAPNKNSATKPIQIQSQMIQQPFKPGTGMQPANIQATPIQFANTNGQQIMFSSMQTAQTIWSPQQGQFVTTQPQQVLLRSPQGDQTAMVLQQSGQSQFQTMPVQIAQAQTTQQSQQATPTMQVSQQPVIQMPNGTYAQVTTAAPATPTKSAIIQPKVQPESMSKNASKAPVKLAPNSMKSEGTFKLAPKTASTPQLPANTIGSSLPTSNTPKSTVTNSSRTSFGSNSFQPIVGTAKQVEKKTQSTQQSQQTAAPSTRTVNTQVSKKVGSNGPDKRSLGTDNPALPIAKKEESKSKSDVITHLIDNFVVLESLQPFPCNEELDNQKNPISKVKDVKSEQKENITQTTTVNTNGKTKLQMPETPKIISDKKNDKFPDSKVKSMQNGIKFPPIVSKPAQTSIVSLNNKTPVSKSVSTGTSPASGMKRVISKTIDYKPPEKKAAVQAVEEAPVNGKSESKENISNIWTPSSEKNPKDWTIQEVCDFVAHIDGCAQFAEEFRSQEIDGQALMLIKEKHIVEILNTKWGMALKIFRKIEELKTAFHIS